MSTRKTITERINQQKERMEQMQKEMQQLLRRQRAEERKERTQRICRRGAHMESLLPDTIALSDERFWTFLDKTVANDFGQRILDTLKIEQDKEDVKNIADTAMKDGEPPAYKPAATVQSTNIAVASAPAQPLQGRVAAPVAKMPGAEQRGA